MNFIVELLVGITVILIAPETIKTTVIIQIITATIFMAWLLSHLIANEHTAATMERHETELRYVKESASMLHSILQRITDCAMYNPENKIIIQLR